MFDVAVSLSQQNLQRVDMTIYLLRKAELKAR